MAGTKVSVEGGKEIQEAKVAAVAALEQEFSKFNDVFFANYRGLTFGQLTELRAQLRERKAVFKVVKNSVAKIAFVRLKRPDVSEHLTGPTALALATEDSTLVAKLLFDFSRGTSLEIKGGLVDGNVFGGDQVEALSRLPSRAELLAILMGTMKAPIQQLTSALSGVTQKLVRTLQAVADAKASA